MQNTRKILFASFACLLVLVGAGCAGDEGTTEQPTQPTAEQPGLTEDATRPTDGEEFPVDGDSTSEASMKEATAEGVGVGFQVNLPEGYELQGLGPEWYVVEEGTTEPLVLIKLQAQETAEGLIDDGFELVNDTSEVVYADNSTGTVVTGSYQAPPEEEFVQKWYLRPAEGDGVFMMAEYEAKDWGPFEQMAESFRQTK
jgi:hypothetical protein